MNCNNSFSTFAVCKEECESNSPQERITFEMQPLLSLVVIFPMSPPPLIFQCPTSGHYSTVPYLHVTFIRPFTPEDSTTFNCCLTKETLREFPLLFGLYFFENNYEIRGLKGTDVLLTQFGRGEEVFELEYTLTLSLNFNLFSCFLHSD